MRVVGVRLPDGRAVWADVGTHQISVLDDAFVRLPEGELAGSVFVTPEQLIQPPERADAVLVEVQAREVPEETCGDLPGSDLPFLGSIVRAKGLEGRVTAIDPVNQSVAVTREDGAVVTLAVTEVRVQE